MLELWALLVLNAACLVEPFMVNNQVLSNRHNHEISKLVTGFPYGITRNWHKTKSTLPLSAEENDTITQSSLGHIVTATPTRRNILGNAMKVCSTASFTLCGAPYIASAASSKSRTSGYEIQRPERDWSYMLSGSQYNILREGGTERQFSSILEEEERLGKYFCAACDNALFESSPKFHSGTGWPSFATALNGVEVENVNPIQASLAGAELRCRRCGGHLGDVFRDGFLYVGTPAAKSGKRYCIDGAALVFKPEDGSDNVFGDTPPTKRSGGELPDFLKGPDIIPR